ncbi:MAG: hypothetical protein CVU34_08080 [Betaproteobacteria bacterium HGW-Betaproteobacteria-7]|nr:MAG: hypothetical protein CVU34_08080 [Betaproteobacteria bacterium HGW-Betaproteobacteria-7]
MRLTLLVPELIWPEPGDQHTLGNLSLPGFAWLAARASFQRQPASAFETAVAGQFGLSTPALGALRLLGEDLGDAAIDGHWLCADPVHLRFHHERIVLADAGAFPLDEEEAREIAAAINAEFGDIGQLKVATARRWYLRLNPAGSAFAGACAHVAAPLSLVAGRRVDSEIPDNDATLRRWLNEVQMFLHGHPLNVRREQAGKPAVNSLWLWGGGRLHRPQPGYFTAVWSDQPLATGLARAAGTPAHPLPDGLAGLLRLASPGTASLVVLDTLLPPVLYEDSAAWRAAWLALEEHWFTPLRQALGRPVRELNIIAPTIYGELQWSLRGIDRWKFWRRSQPLAALAQQFAKGKP